jgi:biopolymer transport protein ExbB/TolQ
MGQTLLTLPEHLSSSPVFSDVRGAHIIFCGYRLFVFIAHSVVFSVVFCTLLFVLLSFFCWTLGCLSFDLWLLNTWFYLETQATLGTRHRQHWAQSTDNIGHQTQATLGTRHRQHWAQDTGNIRHKTQTEDKQIKKTQHKKIKRWATHVIAKAKQCDANLTIISLLLCFPIALSNIWYLNYV